MELTDVMGDRGRALGDDAVQELLQDIRPDNLASREGGQEDGTAQGAGLLLGRAGAGWAL